MSSETKEHHHSHRKKSPTGERGRSSQLVDVTEVWLICAPGDTTPKATFEAVNSATAKGARRLASNFKFHIPDLKIGTVDVLVGLHDDFAKLDPFIESILHKLVMAFHETLEQGWDKIKEQLSIHSMSIPQYMSKFQWDLAKYSIKQPLKNIGDLIAKQVSYIDGELKTKMASYNMVKSNLINHQRQQSGSLLTRSLADIVSKHDFVTDSKNLTTVIVVVPRATYTEFINKYETLVEMVVPRSAKLVKEDAEYGLFVVTLFQSKVDQFKVRCRENKFVVRDFVYNETEINEEKQEHMRLMDAMKMQFDPLVRWLKVQFGEIFSAWIHVKALRTYVESLLRFGLPVNFQPILMVPFKKTERQLREVLHRLFGYLDTSAAASGVDLSNVPGLPASAEYYPYVCYKINLDLTSVGHHHN